MLVRCANDGFNRAGSDIEITRVAVYERRQTSRITKRSQRSIVADRLNALAGLACIVIRQNVCFCGDVSLPILSPSSLALSTTTNAMTRSPTPARSLLPSGR